MLTWMRPRYANPTLGCEEPPTLACMADLAVADEHFDLVLPARYRVNLQVTPTRVHRRRDRACAGALAPDQASNAITIILRKSTESAGERPQPSAWLPILRATRSEASPMPLIKNVQACAANLSTCPPPVSRNHRSKQELKIYARTADTRRLSRHATQPATPTRMITGAQIKAARLLLGWGPSKLAQRAKLPSAIIHRAESVNGGSPSLCTRQRLFETRWSGSVSSSRTATRRE